MLPWYVCSTSEASDLQTVRLGSGLDPHIVDLTCPSDWEVYARESPLGCKDTCSCMNQVSMNSYVGRQCLSEDQRASIEQVLHRNMRTLHSNALQCRIY